MHYVGTRVALNYPEQHFPLEITLNKCSIWVKVHRNFRTKLVTSKAAWRAQWEQLQGLP